MRRLIFGLVGGLLLGGCAQPSVMDLAQALNARGISHCLFLQGTVAPYGTAYLYARVGDLNCEAIWAAHRGLMLP